MHIKQLQKLHNAASKHIAASRAAGGHPDEHQGYEVLDIGNPARVEFQREIRQLRVALIVDGKNPTFAARLARQVDAVIQSELQVAWYLGKPQSPSHEIQERLRSRSTAREKLNEIFEKLNAGLVPSARVKE